MIYSYTNCRCKGTFIYPNYSSVQLFYLGDKKVCLSITNAITCPSLTKNKRAGFSLGNPHIGHFLFTLMMENKWIFLFIEMLAPENDFAKAIKTKPKHIKMFIWSCVFWYLKIPWRWKSSRNLHQEPGKVIIFIQQKFNLLWIQTSMWWSFRIPFSCLIPKKASSSNAFILDSTSALLM